DINSVIGITSDSASDNVKCFTKSDLFDSNTFFRCACHVINTCAQKAIKTIELIEINTQKIGLLQAVRKIIKRTKKSTTIHREFIAECKRLNLKHHVLFSDMEVRWNSTHNMLKRFLEFRTIFEPCKFTNDKGIAQMKLKPAQWHIIEALTKFLGIFVGPTQLLQSSKNVTLPCVLPVYIDIISKLSNYSFYGVVPIPQSGIPSSHGRLLH
ncbi:hypothetical protein SAMD00019534_125520, partial [Acytostelium subglobosum LB1]|uniref:hypothetical protein n=1 Tax=Acytostelium subglobosum LB1 TaxID=1410327 RepID=UPI000644C7D0